jgi:hypothetical protein
MLATNLRKLTPAIKEIYDRHGVHRFLWAEKRRKKILFQNTSILISEKIETVEQLLTEVSCAWFVSRRRREKLHMEAIDTYICRYVHMHVYT